MTHLIDKDALVAEIEKKLADILACKKDASTPEVRIALNGMIRLSKDILSLIDTLEVKEVDLDKSVTHYLLYEHCSPLNEIMHKADLKSEMQYHKDIEHAYKAGFELGLQVAQKGK